MKIATRKFDGMTTKTTDGLRVAGELARRTSTASKLAGYTKRCIFGATYTLAMLIFTATLSGCAGKPYGVPPFSQLVAQAPAQVASFQAPDDGTVYVAGPGHGFSDRHLVYSGLVRRGEIVTVDPTAGKLLISSKLQDATIETGKSYYEIWYKPIQRDIVGN